jgi:hypothetical protein
MHAQHLPEECAGKVGGHRQRARRPPSSSSWIARTSIRMWSSGSSPSLSTMTSGSVAITKLSVAASNRRRPQISSVAASPPCWSWSLWRCRIQS